MSDRTAPGGHGPAAQQDRTPRTPVGIAVREAAWAEFYNGNIDEGAYDRIEESILDAEREAAAATPSLDSRLRDFVSAYFDTVDGDGTPAEVYTAEQDMRKAWERVVNPAARLDEGSATPNQGKGEPR